MSSLGLHVQSAHPFGEQVGLRTRLLLPVKIVCQVYKTLAWPGEGVHLHAVCIHTNVMFATLHILLCACVFADDFAGARCR